MSIFVEMLSNADHNQPKVDIDGMLDHERLRVQVAVAFTKIPLQNCKCKC